MNPEGTKATEYDSWRQVAGYYDGDGCVIMRVRQLVLIFYLEFADHCREQLIQVDNFLHLNSNSSSKIYRIVTMDAYHLRVTRQISVLEIARSLVPYTFKKRTELQVVIDCYEDRIAGNQAILLIDAQIAKGFRSADCLSAKLPLTNASGVKRARRRSNLSDTDIAAVLRNHNRGAPVSELARAHGRSPSTIRKIVTDAVET